MSGSDSCVRLVVLVHPGSLCGSYHTSERFQEEDLGKLVSEVEDELDRDGTLLAVVTGDFEEEIPHYPEIERLTARATFTIEADPDASSLRRAARAILKDAGGVDSVLVTGAWADRRDGCVTAVAEALLAVVPDVRVSTWAAAIDDEPVGFRIAATVERDNAGTRVTGRMALQASRRTLGEGCEPDSPEASAWHVVEDRREGGWARVGGPFDSLKLAERSLHGFTTLFGARAATRGSQQPLPQRTIFIGRRPSQTGGVRL